ncbi:hypothetical protein Tsp_12609 [Trichinella spiralis]|uniref:hypothetical protein n=1 Tax=Trichinella spiralis TaxID=6334 RepID=UPI0001EFE7A4|nr:hypothetical protein Tsp_12609 [Trichinella spiralis]
MCNQIGHRRQLEGGGEIVDHVWSKVGTVQFQKFPTSKKQNTQLHHPTYLANFHNVDILPQLHEAIQLMFGSISNHKLYTVDIQFKSELILRYQLKKDKKIENIIRKIEQPKL